MHQRSETERVVVRLKTEEHGTRPTASNTAVIKPIKRQAMIPSKNMDVVEDFFGERTELIRPVSMPRVHLASQSPRRRELLVEFGIEFEASHPGVDDGLLIRGGVSPSEWVASLAYFKAAAAMHRLGDWDYSPGELVIVGADTVVRKGRENIGQPKDHADAKRIIGLLENGSHDVLTGVALIDAGTGQRDMFVDLARVTVGEIGEQRIAEYVQSGQWHGKAGAYNLRERVSAGWPINYEGDPTSIMGLPMNRLVTRLSEFADQCAKQAMN